MLGIVTQAAYYTFGVKPEEHFKHRIFPEESAPWETQLLIAVVVIEGHWLLADK